MRLPLVGRVRRFALAVLLIGLGALLLIVGQRPDRATTMPQGTLLVGALVHSLSTASAATGDPVELRLIHPVLLPDGGLVPVGAVVHGEVTHVRSGRRATQEPVLGLRFSRLEIDHDTYAITTALFHVHARPRVLAAAVGGGGRAIMGGSLRRQATAGSAPLTGGPAGPALGAGDAVAADGRELVLPAGRRIWIRLVAPAQVRRPLDPPEHVTTPF